MGDYDLIILAAIIGGFVLFYIFASSGLFGKDLQDALSPLKDIADTGAGVIKGAGEQIGIVSGDQKEGEACEKQKLACGAGLVCKDKKCVPAVAKIGEQCTPGKVSTGAIVASTFSWLIPPVGAATTIGLGASGQYAKKGGVECEEGAGCVNGICQAYPMDEGDKCYPDKLKCPSGLRCYPRTGWGKCYKEGGTAGDKCILGTISCGDDHTCITPGDVRTKGTEGVCTPNRGQVEGGACRKKGSGNAGYGAAVGTALGPGGTAIGAGVGSTIGTGNTVECGRGLMCVNNVCTSNCKPGTKGQECEKGMTCWPRDGTGKCYENRNQVEGGVCITNSGGGKNNIECGTGLACYPRGEGKCRKVTKGAGDFCHPGTSHHFECPDGLTCWPRDGTGKCYPNRGAKLGELCIAGGTAGAKQEIRCAGDKLTCWPRNGTTGKCYNDPAKKDEPCIHTGNDKIKCDDPWSCSSKDKGHPSGTMGVCK
jgi:hypothetical protein